MSTTVMPGILAIALITQLGSPHYRDRARASQELSQLAPLVAPYLEAARKHEDPEVSQRSTLILATYYESVADGLSAKLIPTHWPRRPWLDMLPRGYPNRKVIIDHYLRQAQKKIGRQGPPNWRDYRLATQLYTRELLLQHHNPGEIQRLLDQMAELERTWIRKKGRAYSPPLTVPR